MTINIRPCVCVCVCVKGDLHFYANGHSLRC